MSGADTAGTLARRVSIDTDVLYTALPQPDDDVRSDIQVTAKDVWGGLGLWLALHEPEIAALSAIGPAVDRELVPPLIAVSGHVATTALLGARGLAALVRVDGNEGERFELGARAFGRAGEALAHRLVEHVHAWAAHGRPATGGLHISAYPRDTSRARARRRDQRQAPHSTGPRLALHVNRYHRPALP